MDIYEQAVRRLKADNTPLRQLEPLTGIPEETLRDIKSGKIKSSKLSTLKPLAKYYFKSRFPA